MCGSFVLPYGYTVGKNGSDNRIAYNLDAIENRIAEQAYDPSNNLARTRSRTYDTLNRLQQDLGALNQTMTYAYDNNSNLTTLTDPLSHATANSYDALNRLLQVLNPGNGITQYAYGGANNLTQVTDPRGLATAYTYDGLNDLTKQVSSETGTTTSTFDAAGNLLTKLDARGVTATYAYDAINRATQVVYSKSGTPNKTHTFTYDSGANAKGRLTHVTDPAATMSWTYDSQGRVASKAQQVGSVSRTLSYGYNSAGQLTSITTPSGQQIGYSYANNRVAGIRQWPGSDHRCYHRTLRAAGGVALVPTICPCSATMTRTAGSRPGSSATAARSCARIRHSMRRAALRRSTIPIIWRRARAISTTCSTG